MTDNDVCRVSRLDVTPVVVVVVNLLRGSLPKSGPLDFATKKYFSFIFCR